MCDGGVVVLCCQVGQGWILNHWFPDKTEKENQRREKTSTPGMYWMEREDEKRKFENHWFDSQLLLVYWC
jgi:hypothetical protein